MKEKIIVLIIITLLSTAVVGCSAIKNKDIKQSIDGVSSQLNKINNEYVKIDYLDPYISENNNYSANMISQLLIEYQKNYNNSINTKDYKNTVFNTRNSNSKYVTIITDTNNIDILNIKPSGKLYNIMFETEIPILNEKYKIK